MNTVSAISTASGVYDENNMLSKMLEFSENIMAPVMANTHLHKQARRVPRKRGTLK